MGKKYQVAVKKNKEVSNYACDSNGFKNVVFGSLTWFEFPRFKYASNSQKKRIIKNKLSTISKNEVATNMDIQKKEYVVVTEQGNHGLDNALFDDEIRMPRQLQTKSKSSNTRARFRM